MENAPAVVRHNELAPYMQPPREIVADATEKAKVLKDVVQQAGLSRKLGGNKEYLEFEAWQTIGKFYGCTPFIEWVRPIESDGKLFGYEARATVKDMDGREVGSAEHQCDKSEQNWRSRPNYALKSMAQTRAQGKALRSVFAWVAVLAGYSPTPLEEMDGIVDIPAEKPKKAPPIEDPHAKALKDIQNCMVKLWPSDKQAKADFLTAVFGAGTWKEVQQKTLYELKDVAKCLKEFERHYKDLQDIQAAWKATEMGIDDIPDFSKAVTCPNDGAEKCLADCEVCPDKEGCPRELTSA